MPQEGETIKQIGPGKIEVTGPLPVTIYDKDEEEKKLVDLNQIILELQVNRQRIINRLKDFN